MPKSMRTGVRLSVIEKNLLKIFGQRLRIIREKKGLTFYDITGEDMPIKSRQHWQKIENGQKNINLITVLRIAKTLDIEPEVLFRKS